MGDFLKNFAGWGPSNDEEPLVYNKHGPLEPSKWLNSEFEKSFTQDYISTRGGRLAAYEKKQKDVEKALKGKTVHEFENIPHGTRVFLTHTLHATTRHVPETVIQDTVGFDAFNSVPSTNATYHVEKACGRPAVYNKSIESCSFNKPIPLVKEEYVPTGSLIDDPVLDELLTDLGDASYPVVVTTDEIMACLMTAPLSRYSWDIRVERIGKNIVLEKRDLSSKVHSQWVHECAYYKYIPRDSVGEDQDSKIDTCDSLERESTEADYSFASQCASKAVLNNMKTDPLAKAPEAYTRKGMYTYKVYSLNEGTPDRFDVIVRCEVGCGTAEKDEFNLIRCFGLLQFTPVKPERTAYNDPPIIKWSADNIKNILAEEVSNNKCKVAKWIALSHLSDSLMKIGFISRKVETSLQQTRQISHSIVSVHTVKPAVLAENMKIDISKMWGNLALIIQTLIDDEDIGGILKPGDARCLTFFKDMDEDSDDDSDDSDSDADSSSDSDSDSGSDE